jgi:hypothetical protein
VLLVFVPVLFELAGVLLAGCVELGTLFVVEPVVEFAPVPEAPGVEEGGSVVSGVGSGGNGFVRMLATISFIPASDLS